MKFILQGLIYFTSIIAFTQQNFGDKITTSLQKNQLFFEKTFIHTNKTSYYTNDNIWFKAYVGGPNNKPSLKTTLLYVCLLDKNGEIIQRKNVLINKGIGKGQFKLDASLKTGKYYIQAYTNYMRNFGDKNIYSQEINILNSKIKSESLSKKKYDVQIFPEGGYLLEKTRNTIGIKSLINGMSYDYSGTIINSKNKKVASFKNEHLGMTKCDFLYKEKERYTAIININDTILRIAIPLAKRKGILLKIKNQKNIINLKIKTNNYSDTDLNINKYHLLFHQRNKVIDILEIDSLNTNLEIEKKYFFEGVNSITLFRGDNPISERKIYVEKKDKEVNISLKEVNSENDSINYKLKISNSRESLKSNISISVLPINTLNFNENTNIKSAFLLTPYIKGYIEKPAYYFNKKNLKRTEHLNLLMLTQGWTKYSMDDMVKTLNPTYKYNFEIGFKLKGTVSPQLSSHLALIKKDNQLIDKLFLNGNKNFSFNELLIYKGDTVKVSFLNNKNVAIKPREIYFDSIKINTPLKFFTLKKSDLKNKEESILYNKWIQFYHPDSEILDEVIILGKKRNERHYKKKALVKKYRKLVFDIGLYYNIELPEKYKYNNYLMDFLATKQIARLTNWKGIENYLATRVNKEAFLFIDGKKQESEDLLGLSLEMEDVENIMIQSIERGNKIIQVFTTENYKKNITTLFKEYIFNEGYDKIKKYYTPLYGFNNNKTQIEIDWKPDLITNDFGEVEFKIKKSSNYLFFIQGFTKNGTLISNIIKKL